MEITKLVIDRQRWGSGALLIDNSRYMCCLGFLAIACGATEDQIIGKFDPVTAPNVNWPAQFLAIKDADTGNIYNSTTATKAISINDGPRENSTSKETRLITLFGSVGIELSFVGNPRW